MDAPAVLRQAARKATRLLPFDAVAGTLSGLSATAEKQTGPDDPTTAVSREMVALGANLAGAGLAAAGRLSRVSRLPVVVPALASATANVPQLRAVIRAKLGPDRVEPLLAAGEAALTVLSGQPGGMLVDALHRVQRLSEARARQGAWARRARELFTPDGPEQEDTAVSAGRPRPLPDGPVERYAARAAAGARGPAGRGGGPGPPP
ncbi:MAG: hypothetical protein IRZ05_08925, partial [Micromonosporaceae bacterium]|nr:hypothetical protein [Micromonosporaceae bacterium]